MKRNTITDFRIVRTIALKDLVDALKNKYVLAVILPALFMILIYRFIPMMGGNDRPTRLRLVPDGNEIAATALEYESIYRVIRFDTPEDLQYGLTNEELPEIGLMLPNGFDESVQKGSALPIQGYMLDFFSSDQIAQTVSQTEIELGSVLGTPVTIRVETIPLQVESYGISVLTSLALTFGILMVGLVALPHMLLEEKDEKTLEVMLVSPANAWHIVLAKSLSGMVITLVVFTLALIFYRQYFVHWWLIALSGVLGTAFAISLGLGLGILVDNRQKLTLYGSMVIVPLFLPVILVVMDDLLPAFWTTILQWLPSVAIMRLVRTSMASNISTGYYLPQILVLIAFTGLGLLVDTWLVRRLDH